MSALPLAVRLGRLQGWFYFTTGIWPLVAGSSFQVVTGVKADFWLAQTVGALLAISGAVLWRAAKLNRITPEIMLLAAGQAAVLAVADVYGVFQPGTTPVYLLDAVVEATLVAGWARAWRRAQRDFRPEK
jgi:cytochrome b subunit of formate dehydrogenase